MMWTQSCQLASMSRATVYVYFTQNPTSNVIHFPVDPQVCHSSCTDVIHVAWVTTYNLTKVHCNWSHVYEHIAPFVMWSVLSDFSISSYWWSVGNIESEAGNKHLTIVNMYWVSTGHHSKHGVLSTTVSCLSVEDTAVVYCEQMWLAVNLITWDSPVQFTPKYPAGHDLHSPITQNPSIQGGTQVTGESRGGGKCYKTGFIIHHAAQLMRLVLPQTCPAQWVTLCNTKKCHSLGRCGSLIVHACVTNVWDDI